MEVFLDFEKPIASLEKKLQEMRELSKQQGMDLSGEIRSLQKKIDSLIDETFSQLSPWQRVLLSRHPSRPYTRDYIENIFPDFKELHGDRGFSNDPAIMAGIATWPPRGEGDMSYPVMILGHQKGRTTKQKLYQNFGMAKPEGYRKSMRLMELADRARMPIITFIDTPGAYPGIETEERGQAQAIAECIRLMFHLTVPIICIVIGEGGSGGALALGIGNRVLMLEYSTYSVISPEGCASILWSDANYASKASECLKMSAQDLLGHRIIDAVVPEPKGGAHRDWQKTFQNVTAALVEQMNLLNKTPWLKAKSPKPKVGRGLSLKTKKQKDLKAPLDTHPFRVQRFDKFRAMGLDALGRTREAGGNHAS